MVTVLIIFLIGNLEGPIKGQSNILTRYQSQIPPPPPPPIRHDRDQYMPHGTKKIGEGEGTTRTTVILFNGTVPSGHILQLRGQYCGSAALFMVFHMIYYILPFLSILKYYVETSAVTGLR